MTLEGKRGEMKVKPKADGIAIMMIRKTMKRRFIGAMPKTITPLSDIAFHRKCLLKTGARQLKKV